MRSHRQSRKGIGLVLTVIALFLIVTAILLVARHAQGGQTRSATAVASLGGLAFDLARSALAEAVFELERQANDGASPLFATLRRTDGTAGALAIPATRLNDLLGRDPSLAGFTVVGSVAVRIVSRDRLGETPYESSVVLELAATVRHRPTGLVRTASQRRSLRVALLTTPRPYDQFTVLVLDAIPLHHPDTNTWLRLARDGLSDQERVKKPTLVNHLSGLIRYVNAKIREASSSALASQAGGVQEFDESEFVPIIQNASIPEAPTIHDDVEQPLHYLPARYCVGSRAARVTDLKELNLSPRIAGAQDTLQAADRACREAGRRWESVALQIKAFADSATATSASDVQAIRTRSDQLKAELNRTLRNLGAAMETLGRAQAALIDLVRRYEATWLETGGTASEWLNGFAYKLDPEEWSNRASFRFQGAGAAGRFRRFLKRYEDESPRRPLNGVVYLENDGEPLELSGTTIHGKLSVIATGDVTLADVRLQDRSNDLLVVQCERTLKVSGTVEASLIVRGRFAPGQSVEIGGNLIFQEVREPGELKGAVESQDARYYSGVGAGQKPEFLYASFSPWASWASVQTR